MREACRVKGSADCVRFMIAGTLSKSRCGPKERAVRSIRSPKRRLKCNTPALSAVLSVKDSLLFLIKKKQAVPMLHTESTRCIAILPGENLEKLLKSSKRKIFNLKTLL